MPPHPEELQRHDPEMFAIHQEDEALDRNSREMAERYRRAENEEQREEIRKALTEAVEKHYTVRQRRRELEIKRLEQQLERLRSSIEKRGDQRQQMVDQRVSQLLGEDIGF
jgi:hypothetical protein